jgi:hypothetical protein
VGLDERCHLVTADVVIAANEDVGDLAAVDQLVMVPVGTPRWVLLGSARATQYRVDDQQRIPGPLKQEPTAKVQTRDVPRGEAGLDRAISSRQLLIADRLEYGRQCSGQLLALLECKGKIIVKPVQVFTKPVERVEWQRGPDRPPDQTSSASPQVARSRSTLLSFYLIMEPCRDRRGGLRGFLPGHRVLRW